MTDKKSLPMFGWRVFSTGKTQHGVITAEIGYGENAHRDGPKGIVCKLETPFKVLPHLVADAPDMLDLLRQWQVAEGSNDTAELNNARAVRDKLLRRLGEASHD